jgi:hypothetical protein
MSGLNKSGMRVYAIRDKNTGAVKIYIYLMAAVVQTQKNHEFFVN